MRRIALLGTALVLVLVAAVGAGAWILTRESAPDDPAPVADPAPDALDRFYTQDVAWQDCGDDGERCATVEVPVDYDEPDGETTEIALQRIPATGDGGRVLFVNPGGPGGSAIDFAERASSLFPEEVTDLYDIVGVDPRGVGESSPVDCVDDATFDEYIAGPVVPDADDAAQVEQLREEIRAFGEGCRENAGALAQHVSTLEVARDMDVARALLGQEQLDWFGASYGTQIGATYATEFPDRVGRMVLDGAVDPSEDGVEGSLSQATGFQRALEAYIADCTEDDECALGDDPDVALDRVVDLFTGLADEPLPTRFDGRELTQGNAFYGLAVPLYDEQTWSVLTQGLDAAFQGDGSVLLLLSDAYFSRQPDGSYPDNRGEIISVVSCLDESDRTTLPEAEDLVEEFRDVSPLFGPAMAWGNLSCTDLGLEAINPQVEIDATGAAPIVVVGTTNDPATPYENSRDLVDQLGEGVGVLVTREGDGHTAYSSGNRCIADAIDAYLAEGTVPEDGLTCPDE